MAVELAAHAGEHSVGDVNSDSEHNMSCIVIKNLHGLKIRSRVSSQVWGVYH